MLNKLFKLKENKTNVTTEVMAGLTTFAAMSYIIIVNPDLLANSGIPWGAVFLATIIASVIATLAMGLIANIPYAQAPAMGINAFFVYTVCFGLGFSWQQALSIVFICGVINIIITVTKIRKYIVTAIPKTLQSAIGAGIGIFIAYLGLLNVGVINFNASVPALTALNQPSIWVFLISLAITIILYLLNVKGAILIGIIVGTIVGIPFGVTKIGETMSLSKAISQLPQTVGVIFTKDGIVSLFADPSKLPLVLITIFSFSLTDTFDTLGTFIGTGVKSNIFDKEDEKAMSTSSGFKSKMDKALFADAIATSIGAIFGTSNTSTYVESAAGIGVGGRTGLTSVVVAILFALSAFFAPVISAIPSAATAASLVMVGILMIGALKDIDWEDLTEAVYCFGSAFVMSLCYSITDGIAISFIFYCLTMIIKKKTKEIHPIIWVVTLLFILNFILLAII